MPPRAMNRTMRYRPAISSSREKAGPRCASSGIATVGAESADVTSSVGGPSAGLTGGSGASSGGRTRRSSGGGLMGDFGQRSRKRRDYVMRGDHHPRRDQTLGCRAGTASGTFSVDRAHIFPLVSNPLSSGVRSSMPLPPSVRLGAEGRKLDPKLRMVRNGSSTVNAVRAEQCAAVSLAPDSPLLQKVSLQRDGAGAHQGRAAGGRFAEAAHGRARRRARQRLHHHDRPG